MKKTLAALLLAGSLTFAGSAAAVAAPGDYPAPPVGGTVSNGVVTINQTFIFSGTGFAPFENIIITVVVTPAAQGLGGGAGGVATGVGAAIPAAPLTLSAQADKNGNFSAPLNLNAAGTYVLTAKGANSGHTVTASVTVVLPAVAQGSETGLANTGGSSVGLANTGVDASVLVWSLVGVGAVAAGASTVVVARRRHRTTADA